MRFLLFLALLLSCGQTADAQKRFKINISKLTKGVYVHTTYKRLGDYPFPANGLIVETDDSVIIVDTGFDDYQAAQVLSWVQRKLKKPVALCIVTHAHDDRTGALQTFAKRKIRVVSSDATAKKLHDQGYPPPSETANGRVMNINGMEAEIFFPGEGHTSDNIVVWLPQRKVLFGGCLVKSTEAKDMGNIADANMDEWPRSIQNEMNRFPDADYVVPGHMSWKDKRSLEHTLFLLKQRNK